VARTWTGWRRSATSSTGNARLAGTTVAGMRVRSGWLVVAFSLVLALPPVWRGGKHDEDPSDVRWQGRRGNVAGQRDRPGLSFPAADDADARRLRLHREDRPSAKEAVDSRRSRGRRSVGGRHRLWSAFRRRSPTPSSTPPADASGSCRSRRTSCCEHPRGWPDVRVQPGGRT
jgi:hypothetical protein